MFNFIKNDETDSIGIAEIPDQCRARIRPENHSRRHRGPQSHPRAKIARARSGRIVIREDQKDDFAYFASETQMTSVSLRMKAHFLA